MMDELAGAVEIVPGRYYVAFLTRPDSMSYSPTAASSLTYCIDHELIYEPFYADFGPLNLGKTYRFCEHTRQLLKEAESQGKRLYLHAGPQPQAKANAAVLVGVFQVLYLDRSADEAYAPLASQAPFMPFRDASCGIPTFNLQPIDCIRGIAKAREVGFLDSTGSSWRFDLAEYEHYEQVEHGDLNWIVPGKLLAFSGPAARPTDYVGFRAMVPEDYWDYFHRRGVQGVVRLNKKVYERRRFLDGGFQHHELYFPDGSCPSQDILLRFLAIAESTPGALAVHCKAGLGRTGVLLCAYMMKHYGFTGEEVIGYIRICRPGSVIGPQQGFVKDIQRVMWLEGDAYRAAHGPSPPPLMWGITPAVAASLAAKAVRGEAAPCGTAALRQSAGSREVGPASVVLAGGGTPAIEKRLSDLSLKQLQERISHVAGSSPGAGVAQARADGGGAGGFASSIQAAISSGASVVQQRLSSSAVAAVPGGATASLISGLLSGARPSTCQPAGSRATTAGLLSAYPAPVRGASASRDRPSAAAGAGAGRAASGATTGAALLGGSISSLRASLHMETVSAASRNKSAPQGAVSQSSDFFGGGWRTPQAQPAGSLVGGAGSQPSSAIARVLAPNGQPRKMPATAVAAAALGGAPAAPGASGRLDALLKAHGAPGPAAAHHQQAGRLLQQQLSGRSLSWLGTTRPARREARRRRGSRGSDRQQMGPGQPAAPEMSFAERVLVNNATE